MELKYETGTTPQYNGNVAGQVWTNGGSSNTYGYDRLDRLTSGAATGMSETIAYDNMGNIAIMTRDGQSGSYGYTGNRLNGITGGLATGNYAYDVNGNVTTDGRNGVTLTYNAVNLPGVISKTGLSLTYTYDATGAKLNKQNTTTSTTTDYVGGIQYTNGPIEVIRTEEGVARRNGNSYS